MSVEVSTEVLTAFQEAMLGQTCSVQRRDHDWLFRFGDRCIIGVEAPWRIIVNNAIAHTANDDRQKFGLSEPIDGQLRANELLRGRQITCARIDNNTADIQIHFDETTRVDVFNYSSGYEGWNAHFVLGSKTASIIGLGGGEVAISQSSTSWGSILNG